MYSSELEELIAFWQFEGQRLESIIFDRSTPPDVRVDCMIALAKLVTEMQEFVIKAKDPETIH